MKPGRAIVPTVPIGRAARWQRRWLMVCWVMWAASLTSLLILAMAPASAAEPEGFLDPEAAFGFQLQRPDEGHLLLLLNVAHGYHLYRDRLHLDTDPPGQLAADATLPAGQREFDPGLQETVTVFRDRLEIRLPLRAGAPGTLNLKVSYQGCADDGLCYPPARRTLAPGTDTPAAQPAALASPGPSLGGSLNTSAVPADNDTGRFAAALATRRLPLVGGLFLLAGLLLSFTPCVLPMIPILSSIILGQGGPVSRGRGLGLAAAYSLGMALVYTALGVAAGLAGVGLAASLQNPWVLGSFALVLVLLALSMFGFYELQMPSALQSRLSTVSSRLQGGRHVAVFVMGGLSALIVGPCVAAPLAGALVYISRTQDAALGGFALFSLAAGMSVPLLLMGASAQALLPRAGRWMERVKHVFGVLLIGVAVWMVWPLLPGAGGAAVDEDALVFEAVEGLPDLDVAVRQSTKPVLVDLYADWCTACKELEAFTLRDAAVRQQLAQFRLLRVDVTANTAQHQALMRRYGLFGPPAMLFFPPAGAELADWRVIGYQDARRFGAHLQRLAAAALPGTAPRR